jgi:hypothetical protein
MARLSPRDRGRARRPIKRRLSHLWIYYQHACCSFDAHMIYAISLLPCSPFFTASHDGARFPASALRIHYGQVYERTRSMVFLSLY